MSEMGHFSPLPHRNSVDRFTSGSSHNSDTTALTLRATSGLMHRSKQHLYSITSLVWASNVGGLIDRDDYPRYPTACLFRQDDRREWNSVIARVQAALHDIGPVRMLELSMPAQNIWPNL